jgi:hypothetical protein
MANSVIEPVFANEVDRLLFLSRLWGVAITAQDAADWEAHIANLPGRTDFPIEDEYTSAFKAWIEANTARRAFYVLTKWRTYRLGKVKPQAATWLATRPNPNRNQARQAVLLQLQDKYASQIALIDTAADLLPLVTGIVW